MATVGVKGLKVCCMDGLLADMCCGLCDTSTSLAVFDCAGAADVFPVC